MLPISLEINSSNMKVDFLLNSSSNLDVDKIISSQSNEQNKIEINKEISSFQNRSFNKDINPRKRMKRDEFGNWIKYKKEIIVDNKLPVPLTDLQAHGLKGAGNNWDQPNLVKYCKEKARPGFKSMDAHEYTDTPQVLNEKVKKFIEILNKPKYMLLFILVLVCQQLQEFLIMQLGLVIKIFNQHLREKIKSIYILKMPGPHFLIGH